MRRRIRFLLMIVAVADVAGGATITVRKDGAGDYSVIQHALDVAAAGDTILIGPGEYLEHSAVRLPAWSWDIESYAHVMVDELTIIGTGADQTFVGPTTYSGIYNLASPKAMTYMEGGQIRIEDLCLRNCYDGLFMEGVLFMDRCVITDNSNGVFWKPIGSGGWMRECRFDVGTPSLPLAFDIGYGGAGSNILVENCSVAHATAIVRDVDGIVFGGCDFADSPIGLQIYTGARVLVEDCQMLNMSVAGIELPMGSGALCEIRGSEISGNQAALAATQSGGRFVVSDSRLEGGSYALLIASGGPGACSISNCDLIKGSGPMIVCGTGGQTVIHDLRNNYWGSTNELDIQSWIIDQSDNPNIYATVLYSPFAGQSVPTESTTWGDLKALFR